MAARKLLLCLAFVLTASIGAESFAQIYQPDVNRDGVVNTTDIDCWNIIYEIYMMDLSLRDVLEEYVDVWLPGNTIGTGDRDALVYLGLGITYGDANADGIVNATDLNIYAINQGGSGGWAQGDFTGDGVIDSDDLDCIMDNWLGSGPISPPPPPFGNGGGGPF